MSRTVRLLRQARRTPLVSCHAWRCPYGTATATTTSSGTTLQPMTEKLIEGILNHDRLSLSRAITLCESSLPSHQKQAELLLDKVLASRPKTESIKSFRVGIAGPPGAGKSTFIETLGLYLTKRKHHVAVLAIDPSSSRSGGSILGDKTRMTYLSTDDKAFVRPSPTSGTLGGVAQHTNDIVLLCETAGYEIVLVESVGLGQSEIVIDDTVDMVMLIVPPGGGDELQGSKKGIMEIADLVVVNKADGELKRTAQRTAGHYKQALSFMRAKTKDWKPPVRLCSAKETVGIDKIWDTIQEYRGVVTKTNDFIKKREYQNSQWMWNQLQQDLILMVRKDAILQETANNLKKNLVSGHVCPRTAAKKMLDVFLQRESKD